MADHMFEASSVNIGGKRGYTVVASIVAHTLAIASAIIVPLLATDNDLLPRRMVIAAFSARPPLPPSPPPPSPSVAARAPLPVSRPAAPVEAPAEIRGEIPVQSNGESLAGIEYSIGLVPGGEYSAPAPPPPPQPVTAQAPVRLSTGVKQPVKIKDAAPLYPRIAQASRIEGLVIIEATIGPTGKVEDARVLRSSPLLDAAALEAVRQWEYTPTLLNGSPVAVLITVTVNFRLQ